MRSWIQSEKSESHKDFNCSHLFYEYNSIPIKIWAEVFFKEFYKLIQQTTEISTVARVSKTMLTKKARLVDELDVEEEKDTK